MLSGDTIWAGCRGGLPAAAPRAAIGGAAAFLLSDQAGWITGQTLVVDGGLFLNAGVA